MAGLIELPSRLWKNPAFAIPQNKVRARTDLDIKQESAPADLGEARLPPELQAAVIDQVFIDKDNASYPAYKDDLPLFLALRLVSHHLQKKAHSTYLPGPPLLAGEVAARLLELGEEGEEFDRMLGFGSTLLGGSTQLSLRLDEAQRVPTVANNEDANLLVRAVNRVLPRCTSLIKLEIVAGTVDLASLDVSSLPSNVSIRVVKSSQLAGVDFSSATNLKALRVEAAFSYEPVPETALWPLPDGLSSLHLRHFNIPNRDFGRPALQNLRHLNFMPLMWQSYPAVQKLGGCETIELERTSLSPSGLVGFDLASNTTLVSLKVVTSRLDSVANIGLGTNSTLQHLDLSSNQIRDPSQLQLSQNKGLRSLALQVNPLSTFNLGLAANTTLRTLLLDLINCTATHLASLSTQLRSNTTLEELSLSSCRIDDATLPELDLTGNTGLKLLNLTRNTFTQEGLDAFTPGIVNHPTLRELDLTGNQLDPAWVAELATESREVIFKVPLDVFGRMRMGM